MHSALPLQLALPVILQRLVSHICLICPAPEVSEFAPPVEDDMQALVFPPGVTGTLPPAPSLRSKEGILIFSSGHF